MAGSPKKRAKRGIEIPPARQAINPRPVPTDDEVFDYGRYVPGSSSYVPGQDLPTAFDFTIEEFVPKIDYIANPVAWGADRLGEFYWSAQVQILESIRDNRYTAVQSCHDSGKSFIAARAAAAWIDLHEPGEAFVVSTAPTSAQVGAILWRELSRAHDKGNLVGRITSAGYPQWKIGNEIVAYGRKPADYAQSAFQGIHARYVLVIIDEANGVPQSLFDAADSLATNVNARVLAIGNPDDATSHFATVCRPDSGWNNITIDGLRTPNFTQEAVEWLDCEQCSRAGQPTLLSRIFDEEGLPFSEEHVPERLRDLLLSPLWVEERLHRWVGRPSVGQTVSSLAAQSSLFSSKVRGLFPTGESEGIIPLGWAVAAQIRWRLWVESGRPTLTGRFVLGVDVAGEGDDETCLAFRTGPCVTEIRRYRRADTMETTGYVTAAMEPHTDDGGIAIIDVIGIGAGVVDRCRERKVPSIAFNAAKSARGLLDHTGEFKFRNLRAAAWWRMRELLDPSRGSSLMLPDDEMLLADLTSPRYKVLSGGAIQVEPKRDIRRRLGRSTDAGDAVVHSYWIDARPVDLSSNKVLGWFDSEPAAGAVPWGVPEGIEA